MFMHVLIHLLCLVHVQAPRTVCLALDDSSQSAYLLTWALQYLMHQDDMLHIITVAVAVPDAVRAASTGMQSFG